MKILPGAVNATGSILFRFAAKKELIRGIT
jgi:hypothetical protein